MSIKWIDLFEPKTSRTSQLEVSDDTLYVTGGLSHGAGITLKSQHDANRLRAWLDQNFPPQTGRTGMTADEFILYVTSGAHSETARQMAHEKALAALVDQFGLSSVLETLGRVAYAKAGKPGDKWITAGNKLTRLSTTATIIDTQPEGLPLR